MSSETDLSAGLYALGTLDGEERRLFEEALAGNPALETEVEHWQVRLAPLEPVAEEVAPDPGSWNAIASRLGLSTRGTRTVHQSKNVWILFEPGVEIKYLHVDPDSSERTALMRVEPGSSCAPHFHDQTEHCIVLDGDLQLDDHSLLKGDLHIAPAGTDHARITSKDGALLLLRWEAKAAA